MISNLYEDLFLIDQQVIQNKKKIYESLKKPIGYTGRKTQKLRKKIRKGIATTVFVYMCIRPAGVLLFPPRANAIGLRMPTKPAISQLRIEHEQLTKRETFAQYLNLHSIQVDKITMTQAANLADDIIIQLQSGNITSAEAIAKIKGGGFTDIVGVAVVAYIVYVLSTGSFELPPAMKAVVDKMTSFANAWVQPPNIAPSSKRQSAPTKPPALDNKPIFTLETPTSSPGTQLSLMEKPSMLPQQNYNDLSKVEKSYLSDPKGRDITLVSQDADLADLGVPYNRLWYKWKHAPQSGLPLKPNGKVERTEENALFVRDYFVQQACNEGTRRNENSEYWCKPDANEMQKGISLFNRDTKFLAFFTKINGEYKLLTYVQLNEIEETHYLATGNFVTQQVIKNPQWRKSQSDFSTPSWIFPNMSKVATQNQNNNDTGFTRISGTFATDIQQITPTKEHSNNNNNSSCGQDE